MRTHRDRSPTACATCEMGGRPGGGGNPSLLWRAPVRSSTLRLGPLLCAPRRLLIAPQRRAHAPLFCLDLFAAGIRHLGHGLPSSSLVFSAPPPPPVCRPPPPPTGPPPARLRRPGAPPRLSPDPRV